MYNVSYSIKKIIYMKIVILLLWILIFYFRVSQGSSTYRKPQSTMNDRQKENIRKMDKEKKEHYEVEQFDILFIIVS